MYGWITEDYEPFINVIETLVFHFELGHCSLAFTTHYIIPLVSEDLPSIVKTQQGLAFNSLDSARACLQQLGLSEGLPSIVRTMWHCSGIVSLLNTLRITP